MEALITSDQATGCHNRKDHNLNISITYILSKAKVKRSLCLNKNTIETYVRGSRDSSVGIATDYGLDDKEVEVRISVWARFCLFSAQTVSWTHPASYPMGTGGSFPGDKAAGA
jgi:hypothetical protein